MPESEICHARVRVAAEAGEIFVSRLALPVISRSAQYFGQSWPRSTATIAAAVGAFTGAIGAAGRARTAADEIQRTPPRPQRAGSMSLLEEGFERLFRVRR